MPENKACASMAQQLPKGASSSLPNLCHTAASLVLVPAFVQLHGELISKLVWIELRNKKKTIKSGSLAIGVICCSSTLRAPLATAPRTGQNAWQRIKGKAGSLFSIKAWVKNTEFRDMV